MRNCPRLPARWLLQCWALLLVSDYALPARAQASQPAPVVVAVVRPEGTGRRAGLQPGDVLLEWSVPGGPSGSFESPFDLYDVGEEHGNRGLVELRIERDGVRSTVSLPGAPWRIVPAPRLRSADQAVYDAARAAVRDGRLEEAWAQLAASAGGTLAPLDASSLYLEFAQDAGRKGAFELADRSFVEARRLAEGGQPRVRARVAILQAQVEREAGNLAHADVILREAVALQRLQGAGGLSLATALLELGSVAWLSDRFDDAEAAIAEGLALRERLAPETAAHALALMLAGNPPYSRGDRRAALAYWRRGLAILERVDPDGPGTPGARFNIALAEESIGNLAAAEATIEAALQAEAGEGERGIHRAALLQLRGGVAAQRGEHDEARASLEQSIQLARQLSPRLLPGSLIALSQIEMDAGNLARADEPLREAIAILESQNARSSEVAAALASLARLERLQGHPDAARATAERALEIYTQLGTHLQRLAEGHSELGEIELAAGRPERAQRAFEAALEVCTRVRRGSAHEAAALYGVARAARARGDEVAALALHLRAIDTLDEERGSAGGSTETRAALRSQVAAYYRAAVDLLAARGRGVEAFAVLERYRARALLEHLAQRELRPAASDPALERERETLLAENERWQAQALEQAATDEAGLQQFLTRLAANRAARSDLARRVRASDPNHAQLRYPEPMDLASVEARLTPGTLVLSYSVGEDRSWLVLAAAADIGLPAEGRVMALPVGEADLRTRLAAFRGLLARSGASLSQTNLEARALYDLLLRPAAQWVRRSRQLVILPDGPLHDLPFATLRDERGYLVEARALRLASSATADLLAARPSTTQSVGSRIVAFGDPIYATDGSVPQVQSLSRSWRSRLRLTPLPATRDEVLSIARLFGDQAQTFLGPEATEENAKQALRSARFAHFAAHGFYDERFPLDSGLLLSAPRTTGAAAGSGLLQAWEVIEEVRTDAELVTLSSCDSGLGRELGGEGLLGLTRAFQYAGARAVLASMWEVVDSSTATFMADFYKQVRRGEPKAEALRSAQRAAIRRGQPPFQWAAFQLHGGGS